MQFNPIFNFVDYRSLEPVYATSSESNPENIDQFLEPSNPPASLELKIEIEPDVPIISSKTSPAESTEEVKQLAKKKVKRRFKFKMVHKKPQGVKSPFMDAFVYCALQETEIKLETKTAEMIKYSVINYPAFLEHAERFFKYEHATKDPMHLNTLRNWFTRIPRIDIVREYPFDLVVKKGKIARMNQIIHDIQLGIKCEKAKATI